MTIVELFFLLILIGVALYFLNAHAKVVGWVKALVNVLAAILVAVMILDFFGLWDLGESLHHHWHAASHR